MNRDDIARIARESGVLAGCEEELFVRFATAVQKAMLRDGWRKCAVGQGTTQFCAMTEEAVKAEREACAEAVAVFGELATHIIRARGDV